MGLQILFPRTQSQDKHPHFLEKTDNNKDLEANVLHTLPTQTIHLIHQASNCRANTASTGISAPSAAGLQGKAEQAPPPHSFIWGLEQWAQEILFPTTLILICTWDSRQALLALLHTGLEVREIQGLADKLIRITDSHSISATTAQPSGWGKAGAKCQIPVTKQPYNKETITLSILRGWRRHIHSVVCAKKAWLG